MLRELARRERIKPDESQVPDVLEGSFKEQVDFILDPSRRKFALCARRSGKSTAAGLLICREALLNPGCCIHYVSIIRENAMKVLQNQVLGPINDKFALNIEFRQHPAKATFPNGSVVYLVGAASNEKERQKLRGTKNRLIVVDEVQEFPIDVRDMVMSSLGPSLMDERGQMVLLGTPGTGRKTFWYEVTNGIEPGWSGHKWLGTDNPYMKEQVEEEIAGFRQDNPAFLQSDKFKREYEGKWVVLADERVYVHGDHNLDVDLMPEGERFYMLGVDIGYNDAFACVLVAYVPHDKRLYVVDCFQQSRLLTHEQVEIIRNFKNTYPITRTVIDGANKQVVEDMKQRFGLHLETAVKHGKAEYIAMLNSDLSTGTIKLLPMAAQQLVPEWEELTWDRKQYELGKKVESRRAANHLSDALLYVWRTAKNWMAQPVHQPTYLTPAQQAEQHFKAAMEKQANDNDLLNVESLV